MAVLSFPVIFVKSILNIGALPCCNGVFKELKATKKDKASVNADVSLPPTSGFVEPYAYYARIIPARNSKISRIFFRRYVAKVFNSVVRSIPVDVVYLPLWQASVNPKPDYPMGGHLRPPELPVPVPIAVDRGKRIAPSVSGVEHSRLLSRRAGACCKVNRKGVVPQKVSRYGAIIEKVSDSLGVHSGLHWSILKYNTYKGGTQHVR